MNLELFNKLNVKGSNPSQRSHEWLMFLEICETYLKKHGIENPIVVELGTYKNRQKKFYEQLLGAEHIGIDISDERNLPDILGDTHDSKIMEALKEKLKGRPINILFIDAGHLYEDVKRDFEDYSPLCDGIIAFHDIDSYRYRKRKNWVWKFWDNLRKSAVNEGKKKYRNFLFLSIYLPGSKMGIGMMIKK